MSAFFVVAPLSESQDMVAATVRRFVAEEIIPLERDLDQDAYELPQEERARLEKMTRQMGFWQMAVPSDLGGAGLDLTTRCIATEELSQHRAGLYHPAYDVFGIEPYPGLYRGTPEVIETYLAPCVRGEKRGFFALTEASGGSDPARAIQMSAVRDGDDWVLNGAKMFISFAGVADFGLVFARTDPKAGRNGITCFLVDTNSPGFAIRRRIRTLRSDSPWEITFDDVRVDAGNVLGEVGEGFAIANERLAYNRIPYAASCIGVAAAAQRMSVTHARSRSTFGGILAAKQAIQWMLVDSEIDIQTSRLLTMRAAAKADAGDVYRNESSMAKLVATEAAGRVVDRAIQMHGGYGVTQDLPLERWFRELRIRRIGEGPSEVHRVVIARDLLATPQ